MTFSPETLLFGDFLFKWAVSWVIWHILSNSASQTWQPFGKLFLSIFDSMRSNYDPLRIYFVLYYIYKLTDCLCNPYAMWPKTIIIVHHWYKLQVTLLQLCILLYGVFQDLCIQIEMSIFLSSTYDDGIENLALSFLMPELQYQFFCINLSHSTAANHWISILCFL